MGKQYVCDLHVYSLLVQLCKGALGCLPQSLSVSYDSSISLSHERLSKTYSSWCERVKIRPRAWASGTRGMRDAFTSRESWCES